jgi:hypothetical protein
LRSSIRQLPNIRRWMRNEKVFSSTRKCFPQLRIATTRSPSRRSLAIVVLPSTATMRLPAKRCASSRRITIDGPSGTSACRSL